MLYVMIHGLSNRELDFYSASSLKELSTYRQIVSTHYPDNEAIRLCSLLLYHNAVFRTNRGEAINALVLHYRGSNP